MNTVHNNCFPLFRNTTGINLYLFRNLLPSRSAADVQSRDHFWCSNTNPVANPNPNKIVKIHGVLQLSFQQKLCGKYFHPHSIGTIRFGASEESTLSALTAGKYIFSKGLCMRLSIRSKLNNRVWAFSSHVWRPNRSSPPVTIKQSCYGKSDKYKKSCRKRNAFRIVVVHRFQRLNRKFAGSKIVIAFLTHGKDWRHTAPGFPFASCTHGGCE